MSLLKILLNKIRNRVDYHIFGIIILFILVFCYSTIGFYLTESELQPSLTILDSAWWALVTMTTVGYGDLAPSTSVGRFLIGYPTLVVGVALLGYLLSLMANFVFEAQLNERKGKKIMTIINHVLILRYYNLKNTLNIVQELKKDDNTKDSDIVLVADNIAELPPELVKLGIKFVQGDPSQVNTLERANYKEAKSAIILANRHEPQQSDLKNLAVVLSLESKVHNIHTVVECLKAENVGFYKQIGCNSVVCMEALSGQIMTQEIQDPGISAVIKELTSNTIGKQMYLVAVPKECANVRELAQYFESRQSLLTGIRRGETSIIVPNSDTTLVLGDQAIVISKQRPQIEA